MFAPAPRWSGLVGSTAIVVSSGSVEPEPLTRTLGCWACPAEGQAAAATTMAIRWARGRGRMEHGVGQTRATPRNRVAQRLLADQPVSWTPTTVRRSIVWYGGGSL